MQQEQRGGGDFDRGVHHGNGRTARSASATERHVSQDGNVLEPPEHAPARRATRWGRHHRLPAREPVNADVQKTPDDETGGPDVERYSRDCRGCGEPMMHPVGYRLFRWQVCSNRCYQRARRKLKRMLKNCEVCKQGFKPARNDARFCSNACRQWAYRIRCNPRIAPPPTE